MHHDRLLGDSDSSPIHAKPPTSDLVGTLFHAPGEDPIVCAAHAEWGQRFARHITTLPPLRPGDRDLSPHRYVS